MALNILYPPILPAFQPGFSDNRCRIFFNLPALNTISDIKYVLISVKNQVTNRNVLNKNKYPSEIKLDEVRELIGTNTKQYYIDLLNIDMDGGFQSNQYYKIQLRFCGTEAPPPREDFNVNSDRPQSLGNWLFTNSNYFSEWSTVCLTRYIEKPSLQPLLFIENNTIEINDPQTLQFVGKINYPSHQETDSLSSFQIKLYTTSPSTFLVEDSRVVGTSMFENPNQIVYTFQHQLKNDTYYKILLTIKTKNLYTKSFIFPFHTNFINETEGEFSLSATEAPDEGVIKLNIMAPSISSPTRVVFRRTSSKTNFEIWEDMVFIQKDSDYDKIEDNTFLDVLTMDNTTVSVLESQVYKEETYKGLYITREVNSIIFDKTVESGIWYKYAVQTIDENGVRGRLQAMEEPVIVFFDAMFLDAENKQLKISLNQKITSYKKNLLETKIDTIGSEYPYIKRNAASKYRQFSVSGLLSFAVQNEEDIKINDSVGNLFCTKGEENIFISKEALYGGADSKALYEKYNRDRSIVWNNDYILEREFREKVVDFLYKDNVKLLRTLTEGNLLVRLMDISLTPETSLGNLLYSFSATAYEVDEYSIANCTKYNVLWQNLDNIETETL